MSSALSSLDNLLLHPALWRAADARRGAEGLRQGADHAGIGTGYPLLDQALPGGGWPEQGLAELLCPHWACGEAELLAPLLRQLSAQPRWLVWVNPPWLPFPPALAQQGVTLDNTLLLRCEQEKDALWAMEQCLASGSCSLVQGWPAHPQPNQLRRLQLAAQKGHSLGLLLRPSLHGQQPSPAPLRLELAPLQLHPRVRIVKCAGHWGSDWLTLKPAPDPSSLSEPALPMGVATQLPQSDVPAPLLPLRPIPHRPSAHSSKSGLPPTPGPQPPGA
jgi:hypothetical protein